MTRARVLAAVFGVSSLVFSATPTATRAGAAQQGGDSPQQPPPVFRSNVETVAVYATAFDMYGELVQNLDRDAFEVYDDGKRQPLTVFVNGLQPITAIVLVDTSASMALNLDLERTAAEQFLVRMLPGDKARVGSFSDRIDLTEIFTGDRDQLLRALGDDLHTGNPTKLWDAVDQTMTALAPLGGRRIIMLMTDGMDTLSQHRSEEILSRARLDDLMIYTVQFRPNMRANLAELPMSPSAGQLLSGDPHTLNTPPDDSLRRLSALTGGGHFTLGQYDNVNATFTRVMQELHYQYVLGFTPPHLDGKLHTIEVRVVDKPGVVVRARASYVAPGGKETDQVKSKK